MAEAAEAGGPLGIGRLPRPAAAEETVPPCRGRKEDAEAVLRRRAAAGRPRVPEDDHPPEAAIDQAGRIEVRRLAVGRIKRRAAIEAPRADISGPAAPVSRSPVEELRGREAVDPATGPGQTRAPAQEAVNKALERGDRKAPNRLDLAQEEERLLIS